MLTQCERQRLAELAHLANGRTLEEAMHLAASEFPINI